MDSSEQGWYRTVRISYGAAQIIIGSQPAIGLATSPVVSFSLACTPTGLHCARIPPPSSALLSGRFRRTFTTPPNNLNASNAGAPFRRSFNANSDKTVRSIPRLPLPSAEVQKSLMQKMRKAWQWRKGVMLDPSPRRGRQSKGLKEGRGRRMVSVCRKKRKKDKCELNIRNPGWLWYIRNMSAQLAPTVEGQSDIASEVTSQVQKEGVTGLLGGGNTLRLMEPIDDDTAQKGLPEGIKAKLARKAESAFKDLTKALETKPVFATGSTVSMNCDFVHDVFNVVVGKPELIREFFNDVKGTPSEPFETHLLLHWKFFESFCKGRLQQRLLAEGPASLANIKQTALHLISSLRMLGHRTPVLYQSSAPGDSGFECVSRLSVLHKAALTGLLCDVIVPLCLDVTALLGEEKGPAGELSSWYASVGSREMWEDEASKNWLRVGGKRSDADEAEMKSNKKDLLIALEFGQPLFSALDLEEISGLLQLVDAAFQRQQRKIGETAAMKGDPITNTLTTWRSNTFALIAILLCVPKDPCSESCVVNEQMRDAAKDLFGLAHLYPVIIKLAGPRHRKEVAIVDQKVLQEACGYLASLLLWTEQQSCQCCNRGAWQALRVRLTEVMNRMPVSGSDCCET